MDTREQILAEARAIILAEGHERLRITSLARRLGMSHANVYRYFANRAALIGAVAGQQIALAEKLLADALAAEDSLEDALVAGITVLVDLKRERVRDGADQVVSMVMAEAPERAMAHVEAQVTQVEDLLARHLPERAPPRRRADAAAIVDAASGLLTPWVLLLPDEARQQRIASVARLLARGLAGR